MRTTDPLTPVTPQTPAEIRDKIQFNKQGDYPTEVSTDQTLS